jgi:hypothetical protein
MCCPEGLKIILTSLILVINSGMIIVERETWECTYVFKSTCEEAD